VADSGIGVQGDSNSGYGVAGNSVTGVDIAAVGQGRLFQLPQSTAGAPSGSAVSYAKGEQIRDANGDLWICTVGGSPGVWKRLSSVVPVTNVRVLNTRPSHQIGPYTGPISNNQVLTVQLAGQTFTRSDGSTLTIPATASGVMGNLTAADATGGCFLAIVPSGASHTGVSSVNFLAQPPGAGTSNSFTVALSSGGAVDIYTGNCSSYEVNIIMDIFGFVE
jgi:hypothetical protein